MHSSGGERQGRVFGRALKVEDFHQNLFIMLQCKKMKRGTLYVTNFIANAAVLVFEIAGGRILAPYLGTSTEVWAGLIAVILGGLALGYWFGGRLAGNEPSPRTLTFMLFAAGGTALVPWALRDLAPFLFLWFANGLSLTAYAVIIGTILFAPTTILLGAVSVYVARLAIRDLDSAAAVIGRLYAIGAVGSIAGAIVTGSLLIPSFGLGNIILGVATTLTVLALFLTFTEHKRVSAKGIGFVGCIAVLFFISNIPGAFSNSITVADVDTPYSRVWIIEQHDDDPKSGTRYLNTDPFSVQCAMFFDKNGVREDTLVFPYLKGFLISDAIVPSAGRALMLGGCNYSFPRFFLHRHPEATVDVVELDPGMTHIARTWFGLTDTPRLTVRHEDARRAVTQIDEPYDIVFMDTFNSFASAPFQLTTREFFESLRSKVTGNGMVIMNIIGPLEGEGVQFSASVIRTIHDVFPVVKVYQNKMHGVLKAQNLLVMATPMRDAPFPLQFSEGGETFILVPALVLSALEEKGILLTDDYAPIEALTRPIRAEIIEKLPELISQ